jgi:hypothetical protein
LDCPHFFVLVVSWVASGGNGETGVVLVWLENDDFATKKTNIGAKSCTNQFGCQIAICTMAAIWQGSIYEFMKIILAKTICTIGPHAYS